MYAFRWVVIIIGVGYGASSLFSQTVPIYVNPEGNDAWSGLIARPNKTKTDGPLNSLQGACNVIRRLKKSKMPFPGVSIKVHDGKYFITEPIKFSDNDGGTKSSPVVIEAEDGAHPTFIGGRILKGFRKGKGGLWYMHIPEVAQGRWYFEQLYVNGRRAIRAKSPNKNYFYMERRSTQQDISSLSVINDLSKSSFIACSTDIKPLLSIRRSELRDVVAVVYHSWEVSKHRIESIDSLTNGVLLSNPAPWEFLGQAQNQRYQIENFREALDEPGEWFLSREGMLYYMPLPGENIKTVVIIAPIVDHFLIFEGKPTQEGKIQHIVLKGLRFQYAKAELSDTGYQAVQAANTLSATVILDNAERISFVGCNIAHTGEWGMWFRRGCANSEVSNCILQDLGAGAIRIGETEEPRSPETITHAIKISNNSILEGGRLYPGATGILIGHSYDNLIRHNDVSEFYYSGISVGWRWGYEKSFAYNNKLEYNYIHHIGQGVLSDLGGIYTLGVSPGTEISNNVINDVVSYDYYGHGGWGIYNDEGSSFIESKNNLVYNTSTGGYFLHYGKGNIVQNNIFAFSKNEQLQLGQTEGQVSVNFQNNIVYWNDGELLSGNWMGANVKVANNVFFNSSRRPVLFNGMPFEKWRMTKHDSSSMIIDPEFMDIGHGNFNLRSESPVFKIGFKQFDYSAAGNPEDSFSTAKTKAATTIFPIQSPPPPPPIRIREDFDRDSISAFKAHARIITEGRGDTIDVVSGISGREKGKCLRVVDAAYLAKTYNPHFFYNLLNVYGVAHLSFDLKLQEGAIFAHSWRDWRSSEFQTGPSIIVRENRLWANGIALAEIPSDVWVHFEIECALGGDQIRTWDVKVTVPGSGSKRFSGLKIPDRGFTALTWLGFSSQADVRTIYYVDNLSLTTNGISTVPCEPLIDR